MGKGARAQSPRGFKYHKSCLEGACERHPLVWKGDEQLWIEERDALAAYAHSEVPTYSQQMKHRWPRPSPTSVDSPETPWLEDPDVGRYRIVYPSLLSTASLPRAEQDRANQVCGQASRTERSRLKQTAISVSLAGSRRTCDNERFLPLVFWVGASPREEGGKQKMQRSRAGW